MSLKLLFWITAFVTLLQLSHGVPVVDYSLQDELISARASDPGYRLPKDFLPEAYDIRITDIDLELKVFSGRTSIWFWCTRETNILKLHASPTLTIDSVGITIVNTNNTNEIITQTTALNSVYEILTITTNIPFKVDNKYSITFGSYRGVMSHKMVGFYVSQYNLDGKLNLLGTTQLQPVHARKVFPCFDEPGFKATFTLGIQRPGNESNIYEASVSNMNLNTDIPITNRIDNFYVTPKMSTYLVAIIVSKFKALESNITADKNTFRILGRPGAEGQGQYAFSEGQKIVDTMGTYMNRTYYSMGNNKMDQAALPDFDAGAMENWGLLTYREAYLLADGNTSVRYKQQISAILSHEITHMWFGDLVTCHWWSDTWLNEGFARYFQYKLTDMIESPNYKMMTQFPVLVLQGALLADTTIRSAPLTNNEVNSPAEVSAHFGTISYSKGASIIRMMESWLGSRNFQTSLSVYMNTNAYGSVTPNDLYAALQLNAQEGQNVSEVMSSWVEQSGYPLITVKINYATKNMEISQERFKKPWEANLTTTYMIPITMASKTQPNFTNVAADYLLTNKTGVINNIPVSGEEWVILNKQQIGYYRVNYDVQTWKILREALMGAERKNIHQLNRGQIVDDLLNLAREDVISYNITLDVLEFLGKEDEYAPWQSAFPGFSFIRQQLNTNRKILEKFDKHVLNLMNTVTGTLKFTDEGDLLTQLFRLNTMNFACSLGHSGCVNYAKENFNEFIWNNTAVTPNFREFVYCTGLRNGNETEFDKLWDKFKAENLVNEKIVMMNALGCTKIENKIMSLLDEIMKNDSLIRDQDNMACMNAIINGNLDNPEYVLTYIENPENFLVVRNKFGSYEKVFDSLGPRLTGYQVSRFHRLILDNADVLSKSEITAGMNAYTNLAQQGNYIVKAGEEIEVWLDEKYRNGAGTLGTSLVLLCIGFLVNQFNSSS